MHLYIQPQRDTWKHTVSRSTSSLQEFMWKNFSKKTLFRNYFRSAVVMIYSEDLNFLSIETQNTPSAQQMQLYWFKNISADIFITTPNLCLAFTYLLFLDNYGLLSLIPQLQVRCLAFHIFLIRRSKTEIKRKRNGWSPRQPGLSTAVCLFPGIVIGAVCPIKKASNDIP